jgi:hypothetical protein
MNGIFTGKITSWNDTRISDLNPSMRFLGSGGVDGTPLGEGGGAHSIIRIVREDESGTTQQFARALAFFESSNQLEAEIDSHSLKGSALPEWPTADAPQQGVTCMLLNCTSAWCRKGTFLDRKASKCVSCPSDYYNAQERHRMSSCVPCQTNRCSPFVCPLADAPQSHVYNEFRIAFAKYRFCYPRDFFLNVCGLWV